MHNFGTRVVALNAQARLPAVGLFDVIVYIKTEIQLLVDRFVRCLGYDIASLVFQNL